ncbi:small subunit ribosomal protein S27e, partial [Phenoliferia sp. Uapishka_3]
MSHAPTCTGSASATFGYRNFEAKERSQESRGPRATTSPLAYFFLSPACTSAESDRTADKKKKIRDISSKDCEDVLKAGAAAERFAGESPRTRTSWTLSVPNVLLTCFFIRAGCFNITTVFSHAQTVVLCGSCSTVLCQPTGGKARLTEGRPPFCRSFDKSSELMQHAFTSRLLFPQKELERDFTSLCSDRPIPKSPASPSTAPLLQPDDISTHSYYESFNLYYPGGNIYYREDQGERSVKSGGSGTDLDSLGVLSLSFAAALPQRASRRSPSLAIPPSISQPATPRTTRRDTSDSSSSAVTLAASASAVALKQIAVLQKQLATETSRAAMIPLRRQLFAAVATYRDSLVALRAAEDSTMAASRVSTSTTSSPIVLLSSTILSPLQTSSIISLPTTTSSATSATPTSTAPVLVKSYQGESFFDDWYFANYADPTHGFVDFVNASYGATHDMAYVNSNGVAVMSMDHGTSWQPATANNRKSTRYVPYSVSSDPRFRRRDFKTDSFSFSFQALDLVFGLLREFLISPPALSLLIFLIVSSPRWMVGPDWPYNGEIDIVEQVNYHDYVSTRISATRVPSHLIFTLESEPSSPALWTWLHTGHLCRHEWRRLISPKLRLKSDWIGFRMLN